MIYLTIEEVIELHSKLIEKTGGIDGNKRIGVLVMLMTLRLNNIELEYTSSELINLGLDVASGKLDYSAILEWIRSKI